jgi:site-specific DNA recombinase
VKTAAIYCRVSTDDQEKEGTSLQTQQAACINYCKSKGYEPRHRFFEAYSGLTLNRPKLNTMRELVRGDSVEVVVIYCLDRLSRDPTHGALLIDELEKHGVTLEAVSEDIDNSHTGKLISYIRGYAAKLEAEKIKERSARGKEAKAKEGKIPSGGYQNLFGYDYISVREKQGGKRVINEAEAGWVRMMFHCLVNDGMSTYAISRKLNALAVITKHGNGWVRQTVHNILTNPSYTGKTVYNSIELSSDLTPPIIDSTLFEAAQKQLRANSKKASRNTKRQNLLGGHVFCRQCGRLYWCHSNGYHNKDGVRKYRRYICAGQRDMEVPRERRCSNRSWLADRLETLVWQEIERVLAQPDIIIAEVEKQREAADHTNHIETELNDVEKQIKALDKEQEQNLRWANLGFPEDMIVANNKQINTKRAELLEERQELQAKLKNCQDAIVNLPKMEKVVRIIQGRLTNLDYESKRLTLEALSIKVWLDGNNVEITGSIPLEECVIAQQPTM